ncbi:MAG TPA: hypothetical protein PLJ34_04865 [Hyphomicrobiales bacterium]|nr:hypothetical protein [Hyphomicrobiales bacterium]
MTMSTVKVWFVLAAFYAGLIGIVAGAGIGSGWLCAAGVVVAGGAGLVIRHAIRITRWL